MVDILTYIIGFHNANWAVRTLAVPLVFCLVGYVFFGMRAETSKHALQNSFASIMTAVFNLGFFFMLGTASIRVIRDFYDSLNIPALSPDFFVNTPMILVTILVILCHDIINYWSHRLWHTRWGWPVHAAHHSDTHVNAFTSFRFHFLEQFMDAVFFIILLSWMNRPDVFPLAFLLKHLHGLYVHMDFKYQHGFMKYIIASPVFHRSHHLDTPQAYGKNLASIMPIWDVIFGTYRDLSKVDKPMGALASKVEDKDPLKILSYPFRQWAYLIGKEIKSRRRSQEEERL